MSCGKRKPFTKITGAPRVVCTTVALAIAWLGAPGCRSAKRPTSADSGGADDESTVARWANWPMPNPVSSGLPHPQTYDSSTTDVVRDKVTGLMWPAATNTTGMYWPAAKTHCANLFFAGHDDWRLPSLIELVSIVDFSRTIPAIDGTAFPPTKVGGTVWTSTPVNGSPGEAWYVSFNTGFTYPGHQEQLAIDVRCVRSGRTDPPDGRYLFPTTDTVADKGTGLVWQRAADQSTRTWTEASAYCAALPLASGGWRLPSMKELQTILDPSHQIPTLDPVAFPNAPVEQYWASSSLAGSTTDAWSVNFRSGAVSPISRDSASFVRCVR